jgi:hypothetical protein
MGGWMGGWMAGKAGLSIAYSNQKNAYWVGKLTHLKTNMCY